MSANTCKYCTRFSAIWEKSKQLMIVDRKKCLVKQPSLLPAKVHNSYVNLKYILFKQESWKLMFATEYFLTEIGDLHNKAESWLSSRVYLLEEQDKTRWFKERGKTRWVKERQGVRKMINPSITVWRSEEENMVKCPAIFCVYLI